MGNWKRWIWPGLVAVTALTTGAVWFSTGSIEADLSARARQALSSLGSWASATAGGRDLVVSGEAPDEEARGAAIAAASRVSGVRVVIDRTGLLPLENPYRFSVDKSDAGIAMTGFAPSAEALSAFRSLVGKALPGLAMTDDVSLARGAPDQLHEMIAFGTRQLPRLGEGGFAVEESRLSISGAALSPEDYDTLMRDVRTADQDVSADGVSLPPAPGAYLFRAERIDGRLVLSGYAASEEERERLMDVAGDDAESEVRLAVGAPEGVEWGVAAAKAIEAALLLATGSAEVSGNRIDISGDARDLESFRDLQALIGEPLPGGLVLGTTDIGLPVNDGQSDGSSP
jgi:OmpA-OmpF porin, OOP family